MSDKSKNIGEEIDEALKKADEVSRLVSNPGSSRASVVSDLSYASVRGEPEKNKPHKPASDGGLPTRPGRGAVSKPSSLAEGGRSQKGPGAASRDPPTITSADQPGEGVRSPVALKSKSVTGKFTAYDRQEFKQLQVSRHSALNVFANALQNFSQQVQELDDLENDGHILTDTNIRVMGELDGRARHALSYWRNLHEFVLQHAPFQEYYSTRKGGLDRLKAFTSKHAQNLETAAARIESLSAAAAKLSHRQVAARKQQQNELEKSQKEELEVCHPVGRPGTPASLGWDHTSDTGGRLSQVVSLPEHSVPPPTPLEPEIIVISKPTPEVLAITPPPAGAFSKPPPFYIPPAAYPGHPTVPPSAWDEMNRRFDMLSDAIISMQRRYHARDSFEAPPPPPSAPPAPQQGNARLPILSSLQFGGDYEGWNQFWNNFYSKIHSRSDLNDTARLHYFRDSMIPGSAADITLQEYSLDGSEYENQVNLMKDKYGSRRFMINRVLQSIINKQQCSSTAKAFSTLDWMRVHVRQLEKLGSEFDKPAPSAILLSLLQSKIPKELSTKWELHLRTLDLAEPAPKPTFAESCRQIKHHVTVWQFLDFCDGIVACSRQAGIVSETSKPAKETQEAPTLKNKGAPQTATVSPTLIGAAAAPSTPAAATGVQPKKKKKKQKQAGQTIQAVNVVASATKNQAKPPGTPKVPATIHASGCIWCGNKHETTACSKHQQLALVDKWEMVRKRGDAKRKEGKLLCYRCFSDDHTAAGCPQQECGIKSGDKDCQKRHHPMLHKTV